MRVSIKATLLCLIGAIGAAMLLSDASGLNALKNVRSGLATVYEDRVIPLRDLKIIADSYAVLIVDTSHKVRNGGMDWSSGVAAVADSLKKIDRSWRSYTGTYLNPEEKLLVETLKPLMSTADDAAQRLIGILNRHDSGALDHFVRKDLYPSIDPVSERISDLIELQVRVAGAEYDRAQDQARFASVTAWVLIAVAAFLIVGAVLTVLRKVTTPIEHLTDAMSRLAANDLGTAIPAVAQRDEVGEMARAVEVFKRNMIETERMRNEQEAMKRRADEDKRRTMNELADSFEQSVKGIVQTVSSAASQLHANARNMSSIADQTARQSTVVAAATEQASANVQTVAAASEELGSSIDEIGRHVTESARISHEAVGEAERTNAIVEGLASAAHRIGDVVALIQGIASQTNLLALNATIEAARAGEAGKGFAVVASEVKQLANQTAGATEEISTQILEIQAQTEQAVQAIGRIGQTIASVNQISGAIAAAVEEQTAATREIGRNIQQAAQGTQEVSGTIIGVSKAAEEAGTASSEVLTAAGQVADEADRLRTEVDRFVARVRAA